MTKYTWLYSTYKSDIIHFKKNRLHLTKNHRLGIVCGCGHVAAGARPVGVHELARVVQQFVGVGTEVISLGLDQVGGQPVRSVAVVEGEGSREAWGGHAQLDGRSHNLAP